MDSIRLAKITSILLGPHTWLLLIMTVALLRSNLAENQLWTLWPLLLVLQLLVPTGYIYLSLRSKKVTAWDLPKRSERYLFFIVTVSAYLVSLLLVYLIGNDSVFNLTLLIIILMGIIALLTARWKISLHTTVATAGSLILNYLFQWQLPYLYLLIPLTIWARSTLRRHSLPQLLAGVAVSAIIILVGLYYFDYI